MSESNAIETENIAHLNGKETNQEPEGKSNSGKNKWADKISRSPV